MPSTPLFTDQVADHVDVRLNEALAILDGLAVQTDPTEQLLLEEIRKHVGRWHDAEKPVAVLWRFRLWDLVMHPDAVSPMDSHPALKYLHVPLGIVTRGALEVVNPGSFIKAADVHEILTTYPARRDLARVDDIEALLFPGAPLGIFEATDRILASEINAPKFIEHRAYAVFAGSRSIEACVTRNDKTLVTPLIEEAVKRSTGSRVSQAACPTIRELSHFLALKGRADADLTKERFLRLLLDSPHPTPWCAHVLFLTEELFTSFSPVLRRLVAHTGWARMSAAYENRGIAEHLLDGRRFEATVLEIAKRAMAVAKGRFPALVPLEQSPQVLTDTGLPHHFAAYAAKVVGRRSVTRLRELLTPGYIAENQKDPPLMVPGYLRQKGDWGIVPVARSPVVLNNGAFGESLRNDTYEEWGDQLLRRLEREPKSGAIFRFIQPDEHKHSKLPPHLVAAVQGETRGRASKDKLFLYSLYVERVQ